MHVFLEILVVTGVKEHTALKPCIVDLLQGDSVTLQKRISGSTGPSFASMDFLSCCMYCSLRRIHTGVIEKLR